MTEPTKETSSDTAASTTSETAKPAEKKETPKRGEGENEKSGVATLPTTTTVEPRQTQRPSNTHKATTTTTATTTVVKYYAVRPGLYFEEPVIFFGLQDLQFSLEAIQEKLNIQGQVLKDQLFQEFDKLADALEYIIHKQQNEDNNKKRKSRALPLHNKAAREGENTDNNNAEQSSVPQQPTDTAANSTTTTTTGTTNPSTTIPPPPSLNAAMTTSPPFWGTYPYYYNTNGFVPTPTFPFGMWPNMMMGSCPPFLGAATATTASRMALAATTTTTPAAAATTTTTPTVTTTTTTPTVTPATQPPPPPQPTPILPRGATAATTTAPDASTTEATSPPNASEQQDKEGAATIPPEDPEGQKGDAASLTTQDKETSSPTKKRKRRATTTTNKKPKKIPDYPRKETIERYMTFYQQHGRHPKRTGAVNQDEEERRLAMVAERWRIKVRDDGEGNAASIVSPDALEKLTSINFLWDDPKRPVLSWETRLEHLKTYKAKHGHTEVPRLHPKLGTWVARQRQHYRYMQENKPTTMNAERFRILSELGFRFQLGNDRTRKSGEATTPSGAGGDSSGYDTTDDEAEFDSRGRPKKAGERSTKDKNRTKPEERRFDKHFDKKIAQIQAYQDEHGNLDFDKKSALYAWMAKQRRNYFHLTKGRPSPLQSKHIGMLTQLGLSLTNTGKCQNRQEDALADYIQFYKQHGRHPQANGANDHTEARLAKTASRWRQKLRLANQGITSKDGVGRCHIPPDMIEKLNEINFRWENKIKPRSYDKPLVRLPWDTRLEHLKQYKAKHGHTEVPRRHAKLGEWVLKQRKDYKYMIDGKKTTMTMERFRKLSDLGFRFKQAGPGHSRTRYVDDGSSGYDTPSEEEEEEVEEHHQQNLIMDPRGRRSRSGVFW